jgi:hypothetical protein
VKVKASFSNRKINVPSIVYREKVDYDLPESIVMITPICTSVQCDASYWGLHDNRPQAPLKQQLKMSILSRILINLRIVITRLDEFSCRSMWEQLGVSSIGHSSSV